MRRTRNLGGAWQPDDGDRPPSNDVIRLPGFTAGYLGDSNDARWQSEYSMEEYEQSGRSHADLKKVREGFLGPKKIDISHNPGRRSSFAGFWLWAVATMWFGPPAFRYLDRDRLLSWSFAPVTEVAEACCASTCSRSLGTRSTSRVFASARRASAS